MAGDWIKLQKDTPDKPEVLAIASRLDLDPDAVVGKLVRIWSWFDTHTVNGNAASVTFSYIDRLTGVTGFAEQVALVGWLCQNGHELSLPNFEFHNGETAKTRALGKNRTEKHRSNASVNGKRNDQSVTKPSPEKRREEKNKEPIGSVLFDTFWAACPKKVGKDAARKAFEKRKPTPELVAVMVDAMERQAKSEQWLKDGGKFIPHPSTWLMGGHWQDEVGGVDAGPSLRIVGAI